MDMRLFYVLLICMLHTVSLQAQTIDQSLKRYNKGTVPYIQVDELKTHFSDYLILDTRKKEEYDISHLPNAIWVGEKITDTNFVTQYPDKQQPIIVYCSIGVRSENFGENLQKKGYTHVHNLYGSLFAWKNKGNSLVNAKGKRTDSVHVYTKDWGIYLKRGIKIY